MSEGRKHRKYENRMLKKYFKTDRLLQATQAQKGCDGKSKSYAIELFQRDIPQYIKDNLAQAQGDNRNRQGKELLPIVVQREKYKKDDDAIVMIRLKDFIDWFGR